MILVLLTAFALAWIGTAAVRAYALRSALIDMPNERSSHTVPTPRGGGLAVVLVFLGALAWGAHAGIVGSDLLLALLGGGAAVAAIGWLDDHRHVPAPIRIAVHAAAALWALYVLGGLSSLRVGTTVLALGPAGWPLAILSAVWLINLYNFMDGTDGIAATEAVTVGAAGALLATVAGAPGIAFTAAALACASGGFLLWNWAPARIFLGDVGSGFLGYAFAVIALASEVGGGPPLLAWLLLLAVFVFDATATLLRRVRRRERWFAAHRTHAYQRLVQAGMSHAAVALAVAATNAGLLVLALMGVRRASILPLLLMLGYAVLLGTFLAIERRAPMPLRKSHPEPESRP